MNKNLAQPNVSSLHPRDRRSPKHEKWRQCVGAGVKRAKQQRTKAGLLSARDLAKESSLPYGTIVSFLASGALVSSQIGKRRYVSRDAWHEFRKKLAQGGINAAD